MANQQRIEGNSRKSGRGAFVVIVILVAVVVGYFEIVQPVLQGDAPAAAVRQLCADEMQQDYVAVYALLSSTFIQQFRLNETQFVQQQQGRDQGKGTVQACAIVGRDYGMSLWTTGAVFRVTGTLSQLQNLYQYTGTGPVEVVARHYTDTGTIEVVNDHGWKISSEGIDDILYLAG
jgi:hypothetical protein